MHVLTPPQRFAIFFGVEARVRASHGERVRTRRVVRAEQPIAGHVVRAPSRLRARELSHGVPGTRAGNRRDHAALADSAATMNHGQRARLTGFVGKRQLDSLERTHATNERSNQPHASTLRLSQLGR